MKKKSGSSSEDWDLGGRERLGFRVLAIDEGAKGRREMARDRIGFGRKHSYGWHGAGNERESFSPILYPDISTQPQHMRNTCMDR